MKKYIVSIAIVALFILPHPAESADESNAITTPTIPQIIDMDAATYGVSADLISKIIQCESGASTTVISNTGDFGIVQIHLGADHPGITLADAFDPYFSINFLALEISQGRGYWWTCFRKLSTDGV